MRIRKEDCYKAGGWDLSKHGSAMVDFTATAKEKADEAKAAARGAMPGDPAIDPKVIVLFGDAPPHPGTEQECVSWAKKAGEQGFKIYAVKLTTPLGEDKGNLPTFDAIASAGNGASIAADFAGGAANYAFRGTPPAKTGNISHVWVAKTLSKTSTSEELLTKILLDAVNVKYKERIEMIVPLILEACEQPTKEVRSVFAAAPAPSKNPGPAAPKAKPKQK